MVLLYDNDTLVHVDSSEDIIQHYGKKGMKWGVLTSARNLKTRWKNLPESRRKQIKLAAQVAGYTVGIVGYHYAKGKANPYIRNVIVRAIT